MRQENKETITEYVMRLKEEAESCEFGDNSEDRIIEQLIQTIENSEMIIKAIQKQYNLNKFFEEASQRHELKREKKKRNYEDSYKHYKRREPKQ